MKTEKLYCRLSFDERIYYKDCHCRIEHNPIGPVWVPLDSEIDHDLGVDNLIHSVDKPAQFRHSRREWWLQDRRFLVEKHEN